MSVSEVWFFIAFTVAWFAINRWLLPWLGVPT
jgi:hypothetical protein